MRNERHTRALVRTISEEKKNHEQPQGFAFRDAMFALCLKNSQGDPDGSQTSTSQLSRFICAERSVSKRRLAYTVACVARSPDRPPHRPQWPRHTSKSAPRQIAGRQCKWGQTWEAPKNKDHQDGVNRSLAQLQAAVSAIASGMTHSRDRELADLLPLLGLLSNCAEQKRTAVAQGQGLGHAQKAASRSVFCRDAVQPADSDRRLSLF